MPPKEYPVFVTFTDIRGAGGDNLYIGDHESHLHAGEGTDFFHVARNAYIEDARSCYFRATNDNHHLGVRHWWAA